MLMIVGIIIFGTTLCFAAPNLSGDFIIADFEDNTGVDSAEAALILITLDGNGHGTYQDLYNTDELESGAFTYSIAANGQLTIYNEGIQFHGIVSADGNALTVVITEIEWTGILFGVKESAVKINAIPGIPLLLLND